jgi:sortase B
MLRKRALYAGLAIVALTAVLLGASLLYPHVAQVYKEYTYQEANRIEARIPVALDKDVHGVDWAHWQGVNEDVVAWVIVPGTSIDMPVVQERADAIGYYLNHDVYRDRSSYGCAYISYRSAIDARQVMIYGHHMRGTLRPMFAELTRFTSEESLPGEGEFYLLTPGTQGRQTDLTIMAIDSARKVNAEAEGEPVGLDYAGWRRWYEAQRDGAQVQRETCGYDAARKIVCLVTCSYGTYSNERTVVCGLW